MNSSETHIYTQNILSISSLNMLIFTLDIKLLKKQTNKTKLCLIPDFSFEYIDMLLDYQIYER